MMSLKIKSLQQNIKSAIDELNTNSHNNCGLIYLNNIDNFIYSCVYCEKEFNNAKLFESHIIEIHINDINSDSVQEIEEICQYPDDINNIEDFEKYKDIVNPMVILNIERESPADEYLSNTEIVKNKENSSIKGDLEDDSSKQDSTKEECPTIKQSFKLFGPGPFTCEYCCKILKNQHTYRVHINLQHSGLGPFKCNICAHSMKTKLNLDNHIKRVHKNINAPIYQCNFCELGFTSDSKLTLHVHKIHTFEKIFTCTICSKHFRNMGNLKTHQHIHSGIKPFQCEICGKKFIRSNNMDVHKRRHLSDRNIKCKLCNKMFYTKTSMEDHLISHTNEKKFTCDYCSTKFARKGDKLKHIQMKHSEFLPNDQKKYICNICNADFALRVSFRQHMKSQHSVTLGNLNDSTIPKDY